MNLFNYLVYLGMAKTIIDAIKASKPGEAVAIPDIKGIRIGKKSYTLSGATATPEA